MQKCKLFMLGLACVFTGTVCFAGEDVTSTEDGEQKKEEKKEGFLSSLFGSKSDDKKDAQEGEDKDKEVKEEKDKAEGEQQKDERRQRKIKIKPQKWKREKIQ